MARVTTQSKIQVTVEIPCGTYGEECTMAQIIKQAGEEGVNALEQLFLMNHKIGKVVGKPTVLTVTTVEVK